MDGMNGGVVLSVDQSNFFDDMEKGHQSGVRKRLTK